jgi:ABC-type branched-subunit amino acid transport system substrate-binding protein
VSRKPRSPRSPRQATQVLLAAINLAPVTNGKISRSDVITQLANNTFDTIFGSVKFNSKGDVTTGGIYVYQAKADGTMATLKQVSG